MTTTVQVDDRPIRRMLTLNAAFSGMGGLAAALFAAPLSDAIDLPVAALRVVGIGLVGYAALLLLWARRPVFRAAEGWAAIIADAGWVVGTVVLLVAFDVTNRAGRALLIAVAVVVAAFAEGQYLAIRKLS